jgi:hypothetical protein
MNWNYDPAKDPLDIDFCSELEYALSHALKRSSDPGLKAFWCDGIVPPGEPPHSGWEGSSMHLIIRTTAYIGSTGQDAHEFRILLGPQTRALYLAGKSMSHLIPKPTDGSWYRISAAECWVEVVLP